MLNSKSLSLALAAATLVAASASASTLPLIGGDAGDGLTLDPANVLVATTAITGSSHTVQGVTFAVPISGSTTANGVTVTNHATDHLPDSLPYPVGEEATDPGATATANDTALRSLVSSALSFNSSNAPLTITISGLAFKTSYAIDLLQSGSNYGLRSQVISYSDGTVTPETVILADITGFNTHDVVASDGGGNITITITSITGGQAALFNDLVISSVPGVATPEPATLGVLAVGGLVLLAKRRKT